MIKRQIFLQTAVIFIFLAVSMGTYAGDVDPELMKGWEVGSEYNKHYDVREYEKIRAWFLRAKEVVPMPGMSPATAVEVQEGAEVIEVHLCPTWYRKPSDIKLRKNERIKVKGVWAEINGKDVFMASKIKKDPNMDIIKVRLTKDGTPFWTMSPERIAWEKLSDEEKEARMAKGEGPPKKTDTQ
ncbi:MAG: hypothetical protein PVG35_21915 [Desulfobacterales bacterium]|jgi:hypothetical protein